MTAKPVVLVHGGAGAWGRIPARLDEAVDACARAATAGRDALRDGGAALDAVEAAVCVLEDCPILNAGRGSYPTTDGTVEMDAMIMDGRTLGLGAVAAVQRVCNPISLARLIMERTPHALLVGAGASPQGACAEALRRLTSRIEGARGGLIALDARGRLGVACNTAAMPHAYAVGKAQAVARTQPAG